MPIAWPWSAGPTRAAAMRYASASSAGRPSVPASTPVRHRPFRRRKRQFSWQFVGAARCECPAQGRAKFRAIHLGHPSDMCQVDEVLDARVAPPTSVDARVGVHLLSDLEFERDGGNARPRDAGEGQQIGTFDQVGDVHQEFAERHVDREGVRSADRQGRRPREIDCHGCDPPECAAVSARRQIGSSRPRPPNSRRACHAGRPLRRRCARGQHRVSRDRGSRVASLLRRLPSPPIGPEQPRPSGRGSDRSPPACAAR